MFLLWFTKDVLVHVINEYGGKHNIRFNRAKSQLMTISGRGPINSAMCLGKNSVQWVPTVKYLGLHLIGGTDFKLDVA